MKLPWITLTVSVAFLGFLVVYVVPSFRQEAAAPHPIWAYTNAPVANLGWQPSDVRYTNAVQAFRVILAERRVSVPSAITTYNEMRDGKLYTTIHAGHLAATFADGIQVGPVIEKE